MSEGKQTRVVAVLDDMFFSSKIREAAKSTGTNVEFVKNSSGLIENLASAPPTLIIIDLNSKKLSPLELIKELKSSQELQTITTLGYLSHVQDELRKEALLTGFDVVIPRSRFSRELVAILKEYGT